MLSFLALFPSPLLSKPRGAEPGNEASYSTVVPNTCAITERYLLYIVLPLFNIGQTHLTYADRYMVVCCFIFLLLQIKDPFLPILLH